MLWKKNWPPEAVLALIGAILAVFVFGNLAAGLLRHAGVNGFRSEESVGNVLLATLSFQGAVIALGTAFLKFHESGWREVLGETGWKRCLALAGAILVAVAPVLYGLKLGSNLLLLKLHCKVDEQEAVDLILGAKLWLRCYLFIFAMVLAPVAEEFFFRGLLYSTAKRCGWPKLGAVGVSLLFALIHFNAPIFLPLFVLALALTWLYETTGGLLAPIMAHSLFNTANLVLLLLTEKYHYLPK